MIGKTKVYFRADGDSKIGLGHVIRSLAFAEMINQYFECFFIIRNPSFALQEQIKKVCDHFIILEEDTSGLQEAKLLVEKWLENDSLVVLDGYAFETKYQDVIRTNGRKLICIDDINAYHFNCDIVINHAGGFTAQEYSVKPETKILLGPSYALLRREFQEAAKIENHPSNSDSIFICLGGADPNNDTLHVLKVCTTYRSDASYNIVLGSAYLHMDSLREYIQEESLSVQISRNLSAKEMVELMQNCPIAITSPSTVSYEYLSTGGKLFLKLIADNQRRIKQYLTSNNLAFEFSSFDQENELSQNYQLQKSLFDGNQKKRYVKLLFGLMTTIEKASEKDIELYFNWANDPKTRSQSFNIEPIPWENHEKWFSSRILSKDYLFYKAVINNTPVGQIRYDLNENEALINYSVDEKYRGLGIGALLIEKTLSLVQSKQEKNYTVVAYVKHQNMASSKVFDRFGFDKSEADKFENTYKYMLKC